jgi:stage V sporulation protein R
LQFQNETLEYIVTNRDLINLSPKSMIPTLYDYWVNDVEVLKEAGKYKLYPHNPYETVINSRPAISFYNDNNPDWMNVMIFYHVIAHIDFFQNNFLFEQTWNDDFVGQALADKRLIETLRSKYGRWVDYVIEFSRGVDNITGYFRSLPRQGLVPGMEFSEKLNFYLLDFLQEIEKVPHNTIFREIERYNYLVSQSRSLAEAMFFTEVRIKYPEFQAIFEKKAPANREPVDVLDFIIRNSPFLKKEKNQWMQSVATIVRNTSIYFAPQIRSKIMNEGWASYWHDELFRRDQRITGHEIEYAKLNAGVTSLSRIGLNPYAIGMRLVQYVETLADKGKLELKYRHISGIEERQNYDHRTGKGRETLFELRKNFSDFMLLNIFIDQDFMDLHNLFVVGKRLNRDRGTVEYYVKSRRAEDYRNMLIESLYHPPYITVDTTKTNEEGKQLYGPYIPDTLVGIAYLWGGQVQLETTETAGGKTSEEEDVLPVSSTRVLYTTKERKTEKTTL